MVKTHEIQGKHTVSLCSLCMGMFRVLLKKSLVVLCFFVMLLSCPVLADPTEYSIFPSMTGGDYMKANSVYKNAAVAENMLGITSGTIYAVAVFASIACPAGQYLTNENTCQDCPSAYPNSLEGSTAVTHCYKKVDIPCVQNECSNPDTTGCASVTCATSCSCEGGQYIQYANSAGTGDGSTSGVTSQSCTKALEGLSAKPDYFVDGTSSCPACNVAFTDSGIDVAEGTCPDGTVMSHATSTSQTFTQTCYHQTSVGGNITSSSCTGTQSCDAKSYGTCTVTGCAAGYYLSNGTCVEVGVGYYSVEGSTERMKCPDAYPSTAGTTSATLTDCYKTVTRGCTQNACSCPDNTTCTCDSCACAGETYIQYVNSAGTGNGTTSGVTENETCNQIVSGTTCGAGYYMNNGTCTACAKGTYKASAGNATSCTVASEGYYVSTTGATSQTQCPSGYRGGSDNGRDEVTDCYSNTKSRSWTGSQVNGTVPTGCSVTEWNSCSKSACEYVAYSNETGNGDGALKSGCATNNESCTKTVKTVSANNNYYVEGTTCKACSSEYPNSEGGNIGAAQCYYTCQSKTVQNASSVTPVTEKIYNNGASVQVCTYNVICNNGYTASGNGTANPSCDVTTITCPAGKYLPANGTACSVCPENNYCVGNTFDYPKAFAQGITECPAGLVSPQGTTSAGGCGKVMYVDNTKVYLTSEKQTTPALAVKVDGKVYYANTTAGKKPMSKNTTKSLRTKIDGVEYSIHDNTVQGE